MSKKIVLGVFSGLLIGLSITVIKKFRENEETSSDGELSGILDKANKYLRKAKK